MYIHMVVKHAEQKVVLFGKSLEESLAAWILGSAGCGGVKC